MLGDIQARSASQNAESFKISPSLDATGKIVVPTDLGAAIVELDSMLPAALKREIETCGATSQHRSLGMWIRNNWNIWRGSKNDSVSDGIREYFLRRGIRHPDEISGAILEAYCCHLRSQEVIEPPLIAEEKFLKIVKRFR